MQGMATKIMALFSFVSKSVQDFLDRPITLKKSKWNDRKKIYELTSFILFISAPIHVTVFKNAEASFASVAGAIYLRLCSMDSD